MKRLDWLVVLVSAGLLLLGAPQAFAQEEEDMEEEEAEAAAAAAPGGLTMQMSNNWTFTFAGNVHAFFVYTDGSVDADNPGPVVGGLVPEEQVSRIRTGLLPTFAIFEAKGQEKGLDLGVHFGFAPQIQTPGGFHDSFAGDGSAGAQIDMRQVFAFVGGEWGQVLFGRELGLYQRQNILNDQTLFGVGPSGGGVGAAGTTLGRIGFGYIYPNFNAQITYSTPAGRPFQLSLGLFDPSFINGDAGTFQVTKTPRLEGEATYTGNFGDGNSVLLWADGLLQRAEASLDSDAVDVNAIGGAGGLRLNFSGLSLVGSGYYGEGLGSTLLLTTTLGVDEIAQERTSYGYIGQITYAPPESQWLLGASYGDSRLNQTNNDEATDNNDLLKSNRAIIGTIVYQVTKSLKWVFEYTHAESEAHSGATSKSDQGASGLMLFF